MPQSQGSLRQVVNQRKRQRKSRDRQQEPSAGEEEAGESGAGAENRQRIPEKNEPRQIRIGTLKVPPRRGSSHPKRQCAPCRKLQGKRRMRADKFLRGAPFFFQVGSL